LSALFGGRTKREKRLDAQYEAERNADRTNLNNLRNMFQSNATTFQGRGDELYPVIKDFYLPLAQGDRNAVQKLFAPQIDAMNERTSNALSSLAELAPRGASNAKMFGDTTMANVQDINRTALSAQPTAVDFLSNMMGNFYNLSSNYLANAGNVGTSLMNNDESFRQGNQNERQMRMQGLGELLGMAGMVAGMGFAPGGFASGLFKTSNRTPPIFDLPMNNSNWRDMAKLLPGVGHIGSRS